MSKQRRLGKGIDALLQGRDLSSLETDLASIVTVPVDRLRANPDQPRKHFDPDKLDELARSIGERGVIQPILAAEGADGTYTIVAGERRFRAAQMAGLTVVPVLPGSFSAEERLEIALIENLQREDLTPIEEARAYRDLMDRGGLSQDELARRLGKSRPAVANTVRLLALPDRVVELVETGALSAGHARTLLALSDGSAVDAVADLAVREGLSVRSLEALIARVNAGLAPAEALAALTGPAATGAGANGSRPADDASAAPDADGIAGTTAGRTPGTSSSAQAGAAARKGPELQHIEDLLVESLATRVVINGSDSRGRIEITYLSTEDLERIASLITGSDIIAE